MKEETKSKKKLIYYMIFGICALLLIAGVVLTVYFVTQTAPTVDNPPPVVDDDPNPDDPGPDDPGPGKPDEPTGGETVAFVAPIDSKTYSVEYNTLYHNETLGWWYYHQAVDFAADAGTEVRAMSAGTVEEISYSKETGNLIVIRHADDVVSSYRFVEPAESLAVGAAIKAGDKIGEVAEAYGAEAFDGEHLHVEMTVKGDFVDPTTYFAPVLDEK